MGIFHKGEHRLGIQFANYGTINQCLKQAGAKWSQTHKCWHVPLQKKYFDQLMQVLQPVALIDRSKLNQYLAAMQPAPNQVQNLQKTQAVKSAPMQPFKEATAATLCKENEAAMGSARQALILKGYSSSTQRTYLNELHAFLSILGKTAANTLSSQRLKDYLSYCHTKLGLSENTIHSRMNAMKFYYEQVLGKEKLFWEIPRPKKPLQLPKVISEEKIIQGLLTVQNLKHKTILLLAYSAGLRVSETVRTKLTDINRDRMQLFIGRSKGKKDRMVPLAHAMLPILDEYMKAYKPAIWLFENQAKEHHYSARSAQIVFKQAYASLDLPPHLSFHSLRHSYATHLLENGTSIAYIQELLGHNDIKTTLRYTHVSKKELGKIENPLDAILRRKAQKNG
jgi:site-specific recombinase XerD